MKYKLEHNLYWQTIWFIRGYPNALFDYQMCIGKSKEQDGMPNGSGISDPTPREAELRIKYGERIEPIEKALEKVPCEYRKPLLENIIYGAKMKPYPDYASTSTWKRWRRRFVYWVAESAGWL